MIMTKTTLLFFAETLFVFCVFGQTKMTTFKIEGKIQGFDNGTKLYLSDLTDGSYNNQIDSTIIQDNQFNFKGNIKTKYLKSAISTTDFQDRATFWLESGLTSFSADKGNFKKAIILGSKIQSDQNTLNKIRDTIENTEAIDYLFIKNNPSSIISAHTLISYCNTWSKNTISILYNAFSKDVKLSDYAKKVFDFISLNREIKIGDKFVDFSQSDTANNSIRLSDFKGKVILLEFWGSWCGPCREENPALLKIYNDFSTKGLEIFGVASETDKKQWIKAIKTDKLTWVNVSDLKGSSNKAVLIYGVSGYPTNFLIDRNGVIIAKDVYGEDLRKMLLKNL
jgi:peroxiredoxin